MRVSNLPILCVLAVAGVIVAAPGAMLHLDLRSRVQPFKSDPGWREVTIRESIPATASAIILCDMWDRHWCEGATGRVDALAHKIAPVVEAARRHGMLIVHAPSDTMDFYKSAPQRLAMLAIPFVAPPASLGLTDPPLPIDDSDGGCDTPNNPLPVNYHAWSREHAVLRIAPGDLISDNGKEVYSALRSRGITNLFVAGVHTNMCVLNRSFAIRQMTNWGIRCVLIRDLTDSMYNPKRRPFVPHDAGTQLVIEHIEKYWAPTVTSQQLMDALKES